MPGPNIRLDHKGIAEILKSAGFAAAVAAKAAEVEAIVSAHQSIRRHEMPVESEAYETDRAAHEVTIAHPGGLGVEGKYGALTQAARAVGLEVTDQHEAGEVRAKAERRRNRKPRRKLTEAEARHRRELRRLRERDRWSLSL
ncbi:hypothetical protein ACFWDN_21195 [Micromonospora chalcea]